MDFEAANAKIAPHGLLDLHKEAGGKKVLADRCIDIDVESLCNCILRRSSRDIDRESPDDRAPGAGIDMETFAPAAKTSPPTTICSSAKTG